jgi:stage II sporulation protein D
MKLPVWTRGVLATVSLAAPLVLIAPASSAMAAVCPAAGGVGVAAAAAARAEVVFSGHGLGHGVGMSQYGAQGAARLGCTAAQILGTYYPGSSLTARTMPAEVKLWMLQDGTTATVLAESGAVTWRLSGCTTACPPAQPAGSTWRVSPDTTGTRFELVDASTGSRVWAGGAAGTTLTAAHTGTVIDLETYQGTTTYLSRRLRWDETRYTFTSAGLDAVQVIKDTAEGSAMDKYLWGIAEMPISWTRSAHEALRSQVLAARTYAFRKLRAGTTLYPTPRHQNYLGYDQEEDDAAYKDQYGRNLRWRDAVTTTSGQVIALADGTLVDTVYTSSHGGYSEDNRYVWGGSSVSYMRAVDDSAWDAASDNPWRSWSRGLTLADVATKLGFTSVSAVTVAPRGDTERLGGVNVTGVRNGVVTTVTLTGWDAKVKLGLPSTGFSSAVIAVQ